MRIRRLPLPQMHDLRHTNEWHAPVSSLQNLRAVGEPTRGMAYAEQAGARRDLRDRQQHVQVRRPETEVQSQDWGCRDNLRAMNQSSGLQRSARLSPLARRIGWHRLGRLERKIANVRKWPLPA